VLGVSCVHCTALHCGDQAWRRECAQRLEAMYQPKPPRYYVHRVPRCAVTRRARLALGAADEFAAKPPTLLVPRTLTLLLLLLLLLLLPRPLCTRCSRYLCR
jgi:hypothetical protein